MGIIPLDGTFGRFGGSFAIDPAASGTCRVTLSAEVASLTLSDADMTRDALGPDLMDAATYPALSFAGACNGTGGIAGHLTMHGVTRPLTLTLERTRTGYRAEGSLKRADWGIVGRPNTAGSTVKFHVTTELPH